MTSGIHASWAWVPILFFSQLVLISAVSFWVAALVPFVPDIRFIVAAGLQMLMFCSGVFFRTLSVPDKYQFLMTYNPVANLISQFRTVLIAGKAPDLISVIAITLSSLIFLIAGLMFLKKYDLRYPRLIN
jgi:lipopolysaccharide transport system permease protein